MYSATAGLCEHAKGKTHTDLPFPSLYKMIALVRVVDKNTQIALLGMQREFETHLSSPTGNFLNEKWRNTLSDLIVRLTKAPEKTKEAVAHLPKIMTKRAMHMIINISSTHPSYRVALLSKLQRKVMEVMTCNNAEKREREILSDIQTFIQQSANVTASLAHDTEMVTASVGLPAPEETARVIPYRQAPTPGPLQDRGRSRTPPGTAMGENTQQNGRSPSNGPTDDTMRTCQFCSMDVPCYRRKRWSEHTGDCTGNQGRLRAARARSPGVCTTCKRAQDR